MVSKAPIIILALTFIGAFAIPEEIINKWNDQVMSPKQELENRLITFQTAVQTRKWTKSEIQLFVFSLFMKILEHKLPEHESRKK